MAAKRRKPKPFRDTSAVKAAARRTIGTPPPAPTEPAEKKRKFKTEKHKPTLRLVAQPSRQIHSRNKNVDAPF